MTRRLYQLLLWMHPPAFRRQFGDEMLCIFDEAAEREGRAALLVDNLVSLGRQWLVRSTVWKAALAVAFAWLQITAGGLGWPLQFGTVGDPARALGGGSTTAAATDLMRVMAMAVAGIVVMVITLGIWAANLNRRRA